MKTMASVVAVTSVLFLSQATLAFAQLAPSGPGTAGGANAAAASGSGTPTQPGIAAGSTNPGNINVAPPSGAAPPAANPNQVPSGATVLQSTTPPPANQGPATASGSGTVGQSRRAVNEDPQPDRLVEESEREVARRIKNICRGC